jgi:hypothetical protein
MINATRGGKILSPIVPLLRQGCPLQPSCAPGQARRASQNAPISAEFREAAARRGYPIRDRDKLEKKARQ